MDGLRKGSLLGLAFLAGQSQLRERLSYLYARYCVACRATRVSCLHSEIRMGYIPPAVTYATDYVHVFCGSTL